MGAAAKGKASVAFISNWGIPTFESAVGNDVTWKQTTTSTINGVNYNVFYYDESTAGSTWTLQW